MSTKLGPRASEVYALEQQGYYIGKKIGEGSYASVHVANYVHRNKTKVKKIACKILDKERASRDFLEHFFPRELDVLTKVESPFIIQVYSIYERGPRVFIFMSLAENGDLLDYVKNNGEVTESRAKVWFNQICRGTEYLHTKDIAHRDLKCENVLLSRNFNCKLTDFGFARYCNNLGPSSLCETFCGSAAYAAPEVVGGTPYNPRMADVWSLGVILYAMLNASMPFNDSNRRKLLSDQMSGNWQFRSRVEYSVSAVAKSLVAKILEPCVASRLPLVDILEHEWLRSCREQTPVQVQTLPLPDAQADQDHVDSQLGLPLSQPDDTVPGASIAQPQLPPQSTEKPHRSTTPSSPSSRACTPTMPPGTATRPSTATPTEITTPSSHGPPPAPPTLGHRLQRTDVPSLSSGRMIKTLALAESGCVQGVQGAVASPSPAPALVTKCQIRRVDEHS